MKSDLGLPQDVVDLSAPCREWSSLFARERRIVHRALGELALEIEHVGSTAVEALPAKPIIDIAVAIPSREAVPEVAARLERVGYLYRGEAVFRGGHWFVKEASPGMRTHHIHVVVAGDPQWRSWLRFRDFLRTDGLLRRRYAVLKSELKHRFPSDRRSYTLGKTRFIENALTRTEPGDESTG